MKQCIMGLTLLLLFLIEGVYACTGIKLVAKDGSVIHGRTAEFGVPLDLAAIVIPRNYLFTGTTPLGEGLTYRSKYGVVGASAYGQAAILDGMNEKGLSAALFYFPNYASYTPTTKENQSHSLSPIDFTNWILTQFATIEEVKAHLHEVSIAPTVLEGWGPTPPPFHYIVYDPSGASIVIEPLNETLTLYENKLGVITNSPTFDWHMTHLNYFTHLSPYNPPPITLNDITFTPFGNGSGLVGLPGDFSPPSRFVRATLFCCTAIPSNNAEETVLQAFHLLNPFDIPMGAVREKENGFTAIDHTLATAVRDPQSLKFYYKTYEDQTIKVICLKKCNLNARQIKSLKISGKQKYVDVSNQLK